jgi:hypothetical protein
MAILSKRSAFQAWTAEIPSRQGTASKPDMAAERVNPTPPPPPPFPSLLPINLPSSPYLPLLSFTPGPFPLPQPSRNKIPGLLFCPASFSARPLFLPGLLFCPASYSARPLFLPGLLFCPASFSARPLILLASASAVKERTNPYLYGKVHVLIAELRGLVGELHGESQRVSPPRERSQARRLKDELQGLIDEYIRESRDLGLGVCGLEFGV